MTETGQAFQMVTQRLLAQGAARRIPVDDFTFAIRFGDKAMVIWGEPRSLLVQGSAHFYDVEGKEIAAPTSIGAGEPVVIVGDQALTIGGNVTLGPIKLIADSLTQFNYANDQSGPCPTGFTVPLRGRLNRPCRRGAGGPEFQLDAVSGQRRAAPVRDRVHHPRPIDFGTASAPNVFKPVLRYTATAGGAVSIAGDFTVADASVDGVDLSVLVNGKVIFSNVFEGHYSLALNGVALASGNKLDFIVGTNQTGAGGDATLCRIKISIPRGGILPSRNSPRIFDRTFRPRSGNPAPCSKSSAADMMVSCPRRQKAMSMLRWLKTFVTKRLSGYAYGRRLLYDRLPSAKDIGRHPFDVEHNIRTSGFVPSYLLGARYSTAELLDNTVCPYFGCQPNCIRAALNQIAAPGNFTFYDLGCGMGRATIIASEFAFRKVIGVEMSADLCALARENAAEIERGHPDRPHITIMNRDASDLEIEDTGVVIFLYNPFGPRIVEGVVAQLEKIISAGNPVIVVYENPVCFDLFDRSKLLARRYGAQVACNADEIPHQLDPDESIVLWTSGASMLRSENDFAIHVAKPGWRVEVVGSLA